MDDWELHFREKSRRRTRRRLFDISPDVIGIAVAAAIAIIAFLAIVLP
jgi:hypothetical protein